ncbi:unnamed protein product [Rotaria sordida]|uniref:Uncharacterized protein n=1 Tax=Rotaria sordida TaxID=392033 RepID=A0A819SVF7_9BILA|nr:unnamed protein product [Rotaria sordida]
MDNKSSQILADIHTDTYQKQYLDEVNISNKIWIYVDYILIITKVSEHQLNNYINELTTINIKNEIKLKIKWLRKDTKTIQDGYEHKKDLNILKTMLLKSNYPLVEIKKLIKQTCQEFISNENNSNDKNNNNTSKIDKNCEEINCNLTLPYVSTMELLKRRLEKN